jgi:hypothetical protein
MRPSDNRRGTSSLSSGSGSTGSSTGVSSEVEKSLEGNAKCLPRTDGLLLAMKATCCMLRADDTLRLRRTDRESMTIRTAELFAMLIPISNNLIVKCDVVMTDLNE